jgi:hypothetical protein
MKEGEVLAGRIRRRILELKGSRRFAHRRMSLSGGMAHLLRMILKDIEQGVLSRSPREALELAETLLTLGNGAWDGSDDRDGSVELAMRNACRIWICAAAAIDKNTRAKNDRAKNDRESATDWAGRLYGLYMTDNEGVCDGLLIAADLLLDEAGLRGLVARFDENIPGNGAVPAEPADDARSFVVFKSVAALHLLAEPLRDAKLYERAVRVYVAEPTQLQAKDIAIHYISFGDPAGALRWLTRPWAEELEESRYGLLDRAYQMLDDTVKQIEVRRERYQKRPSLRHLKSLEELLSDIEQSGVREGVVKDAARAIHIGTGVRLLLGIGDVRAAEDLLLSRSAQLDGGDFEFLTPLAQEAEQAQAWLTATLLLRAMLDNVLSRSRSQAYGVAAGYFRALSRIAERIADYRGLPTHMEYEMALRLKYARKVSFWNRLETADTDAML